LSFFSNLLVDLFNRHPIKLNSLQIPVDLKIAFTSSADMSPYSPKILQSLECALRQLKIDKNDSVISANSSTRDFERVFRKVTRYGIVKEAMSKGELVNYYQPILNMSNGRIAGCESLVRWDNPFIGLMPPSSFLPHIEKHRQLVQLTLTVVRNVAQDFRDTWQHLPEGFYISVNVPPDVMLDDAALKRVLKAFTKYDMPLSYLAIELTEQAIAGSLVNIITACNYLSECGVRIMIDDFGTGYSSIDRISRLPIYAIKVDKGYMLNQNDLDINAAVVKFAIDIANTKKAIVICEGVADEDIKTQAKKLGVVFIQGFHYSKPVPYKDFMVKLAESFISNVTNITTSRKLS
jgi:EAL domain-containing protein (putative c-di-GMP-specific phosphodiesterase class I)